MRGSTQSRSINDLACLLLILALGVGSLPTVLSAADCDWQRGQLHQMHWPQLPDLSPTGTDVSLTEAALADDFLCTATGPMRSIHLWASFLDDRLPKEGPDSLTLELSLYAEASTEDGPANEPDTLLWSQIFGPGQYTARAVHDGPENWYDPTTRLYLPDNHRQAYQLDFCLAGNPPAIQEQNVYWLAVREVSPSANYSVGWKTTSRLRHWNDRAVYLIHNLLDWSPLDYPSQHRYADSALDLAFVIVGDDDTATQHELGDAPDVSNNFPVKMRAYPDGTGAGFPTVYETGSPPYGPLHRQPRAAFYLGTQVSLENEADLGPDEDMANNLNPTADAGDQDAADDGLQLPLVTPYCQQTTISYTITVTNVLVKQVYVNLWCDWNRDGDWNDTIICADGTMLPEWAVQDEQPSLPGPGTYTFTSQPFLCWHPNPDDGLDPLWVRLTVSEQSWGAGAGTTMVGGAGPADGYQYGETEDYYIRPLAEPTATQYDWGDAPGYATTAADNGARHIVAGPWLGTSDQQPDAEADGQPALEALGDDSAGDDDEDGVSIPPLVQGQAASLTLSVQGGGGVVQAWIDFDADLAWHDSEQVFDGFLPNGTHIISFTVPENAVAGQSFARFRISRRGGLDPDGPAPDGEVEDYPVWIRTVPTDLKWCQWPDCTPRGIDIRLDSDLNEPRTLADDFECTSADLLTHIRFWGSWKGDEKGRIETIRLRIQPDDPVGEAGTDKTNRFSKPGPEVLWEMEFGPNQYAESLYHVVEIDGEWWWDPAHGKPIPAGDSQVWQIDVNIDPAEAFLQQGSLSHPRIYWLAIEVETSTGQFGWKTRHWPDHFMDDAVWNVGERLPRPWQELRYPEGHPCYDHEMNSIDMAFCLMYSEGGTTEPVTSRPASVTQCPAVETMCPNTETQCPAVVTQCPAVETTCPLTTTACPTMATRCPSVETQCPTRVTTCPAVETQCPTTETKCPPTVTQCPLVLTQCPLTATSCQMVATTCPAVETRCPATETKCPTIATMCPTTETQCPVNATACPVVETQCPPTETKCPMAQTACQTQQTSCPTVETRCPVTETKCPISATRCPATETQCPATVTQCPPVETRCPATETKCPIAKTKCPATSTQCPVVLTQCPSTCQILLSEMAVAPCPAVEAPCPSVADYVAVAGGRN